jgi:hypothetical protein
MISLARAVLLATTFAVAPVLAQDAVTLHSVTVLANNDVTVVYSKNFATCAHMRFSNATCTQNGALTHVQNLFCASGTNVSVTVPSTAFVAGFGPGIPVYMVHGNNPGVFSPCVNVACNGVYGTGCAGTAGAPSLTANHHCPPAGTTVDLAIANGLPASVAVLGLGFGQGSFPVFGCNLLLGSLAATATVPFDATGAGVLPFPLPPGSTGIEFTAQAFALDPSGPQGFTATNGLLVRVL